MTGIEQVEIDTASSLSALFISIRNDNVQSSNGIGGALLECLSDQTGSLLYILQLYAIAEAHSCVRLRKSDHAFQLSSGSGDPPLATTSSIDTCASHSYVSSYESIGGRRGELRVDVRSGIRDVCGQHFKRL